jgi:predicted RNA polymerase sigma factor
VSVVACLTKRFGDLDIAEEAAEAFAIAVERWPDNGVPCRDRKPTQVLPSGSVSVVVIRARRAPPGRYPHEA